MKYYIEFYKLSTGYIAGTIPPMFSDDKKAPIPACGSDGLTIIDGRFSSVNVGDIARKIGKERGFIGFKVLQGNTLSQAKPVSGYWPIPQGINDKTAFSATYGN